MRIILVYFLITLSACNYSEVKSGPASENIDLAKATLDFATVKNAIFQPYCVQCHAQYSSYSGVAREINNILGAVASDRMPKVGGPLGPNRKSLLQAWSNAGLPENADGSKSSNPDVLVPQWKSVSEIILSPKCIVCHNPNGRAKFLDLSTRQSIFESRNRVYGEGEGKKLLDLDKPEESYLIEVIADPNEPMPPKWSNISRLLKEELEVLIQWIGKGLP